MGRAPCCDKANVKKGPWSPEEDAKLKDYIEKYGTGGNWIALPQKIGLKRCGKSCRLRWLNYLRPNIKHGGFTEEEDNIICSLYVSIGSRWSIIAAQLPGRTDNDIKNYWNTRLKKKLLGRRKQSNTAAGRYSSTGNPESRDAEDPPSLSNSAIERLQLHMQLQGLQNPVSFYNNPALWPKIHPLQEKMAQLLNNGNPSNNNNLNPNLIMPQDNLPTSQPDDSEQRAFYEPMISDSLKITSSKIDELMNSLSGMSSPNDCSIDPFNYANLMPRVDGLQQPYINTNNPPISAIETTSTGGNNIVDNEKGGFMSSEEGQIAELNYFKDMNGSRDNLLWWSNALDMKFAPSMSLDSINTTINPQSSQEMFQDYEICGDDQY